MTDNEYEALQAALRRKLHRKEGRYQGGNREEAYREGIRAAMSILSCHQKQNASAEWLFAGYGVAKCSKCGTCYPYNTPMPQSCSVCGTCMSNTHF